MTVRGKSRALAFAMVLVMPGAASAKAESEWATRARGDLDAAHRLLSENHPAALAEVGDVAFRSALAQSYSMALGRARSVVDDAGYRAVLRGFAVGIGDPHIYVSFTEPVPGFRWTGLTFRMQGNQFVVATASAPAPPELVGARLGDCDGRPAAELARERLGGFRAVWPLAAERARQAPMLLVDDGNPFIASPARCRFVRTDGGSQELVLNWQAIAADPLRAALRAANGDQSPVPMGLSYSGEVAWVAMSAMNASADPLLAKVERQRGSILRARAIVIDLRGNGGGSSSKGDRLVDLLFGRAAGNAARSGSGGDYHWRATPFVLETVEGYAASRAKQYGESAPEVIEWRTQAAAIREAIAAQQTFSPPLRPGTAHRGAAERRIVVPMARRVFVLTDHACVSSCLMLVASLRRLGVSQLGLETNASRRYMEVRDTLLPSGKARFSTLQKVDFAAPDWFGPFVPQHPQPDGLGNSAAVSDWARSTALALAQSDPVLSGKGY